MKTSSKLLSLLALVSALGATGTPAEAIGLAAKSPGVTQVGGFASWIQDQNGLALQGCLDVAPAGRCILPAAGEEPLFNPANPLSFPTPINFPSEHFYFYSDATLPQSGSLVIMAVEAAFLPSLAPGNQEMFHRFRVRVPTAPVSGPLTLDHPWGTTTFTGLDCVAGIRCDATFDVNAGTAATNFAGILGDAPEGSISRFLVQNCGPAQPNPAGFIGDGLSACPIVADPGLVRTNVSLRIGATDLGSTNLFIVAGKKIGMDVSPAPIAQLQPAVIGATAVTPSTQTVTITNLSGVGLDLSAPTALAIAGTNGTDFTLGPINTCSGAIIPATAGTNTCTADVTFSPAASTVAARTATLSITPADLNAAPAVNVSLKGTARFALDLTVGANGTVTNGDGSPASTVIDAGATQVYRVTPSAGFLPLVRVNGVRQAVTGGTITLPTLGTPQTTAATFLRAGDVDQSGGNPAIADAMRALRIAVGVLPAPTDEEITTADVGPLVSGAPRQSGKIDISDVMVILRRAVGLQPLW